MVSQEDNGSEREAGVLPYQPCEGESVDSREPGVGEDEVGGLTGHRLPGRSSVSAMRDLGVHLFQPVGDHLGLCRVVLHEEHARWRTADPGQGLGVGREIDRHPLYGDNAVDAGGQRSDPIDLL